MPLFERPCTVLHLFLAQVTNFTSWYKATPSPCLLYPLSILFSHMMGPLLGDRKPSGVSWKTEALSGPKSMHRLDTPTSHRARIHPSTHPVVFDSDGLRTHSPVGPCGVWQGSNKFFSRGLQPCFCVALVVCVCAFHIRLQLFRRLLVGSFSFSCLHVPGSL